MTEFALQHEQMSQHVVKLALDVVPAVDLDGNRAGLQGFANALIRRFPGIFETLVSGPQQFTVNKTFVFEQGKAEIVTLAWSRGGVVTTVPRRLFVSGTRVLETPAPGVVFGAVVGELAERLPDRGLVRATVAHQMVFDTGRENSATILSRHLANARWRSDLLNARIQMQRRQDGKDLAYDIRPTYVSPAGRSAWPAPDDARFGMVVNVDVAVGQAPTTLSAEAIDDLVAYAQDYLAQDLLGFLNGSA